MPRVVCVGAIHAATRDDSRSASRPRGEPRESPRNAIASRRSAAISNLESSRWPAGAAIRARRDANREGPSHAAPGQSGASPSASNFARRGFRFARRSRISIKARHWASSNGNVRRSHRVSWAAFTPASSKNSVTLLFVQAAALRSSAFVPGAARIPMRSDFAECERTSLSAPRLGCVTASLLVVFLRRRAAPDMRGADSCARSWGISLVR